MFLLLLLRFKMKPLNFTTKSQNMNTPNDIHWHTQEDFKNTFLFGYMNVKITIQMNEHCVLFELM